MGFFSNKILGGGIVDVIRCDEESYLMWKWHPKGTVSGKSRKENEIRWGSKLLVKEKSVAIILCSDGAETKKLFVEGPEEAVLHTLNFPIISTMYRKVFGGNSPFPAEVYFVNLSKALSMRFAVPYFELFDDNNPSCAFSVAVRGTITFGITDYKEFIRLHGLKSLSVEELKNMAQSAIIRIVKEVITEVPKTLSIPIARIESRITQINDLIGEKVWDYFYKNLGITLSSVDVESIDVD